MSTAKNRFYTGISLAVLALAVISVGSYVYFQESKISADVEEDSQEGDFISVKKGWNYFYSGNYIINSESRIISINGRLISIKEALDRGIIKKIGLTKNDTIIKDNVNVVPAGSEFALFFEDISTNPQVYLEGSKK